MKQLFFAMLAAATPALAGAGTVHTLRSVPFDVDTIAHYRIAPAATFTQLRYQSQQSVSKHFTASVLEFDLTNVAQAGLDFRMHLGRDSVHTSERMSDVAKRHTDQNNQYVAAINGDFFITWASTPGMLGYPNMTACTNGQMALSDNVDHDNHIDAWIMDRNMMMWCDQTVLDNSITLPDGSTAALYGVNFARRDDARRDSEDDSRDIVFYNEHRGNFTGSAKGWREIAVAPAAGSQWAINSPVTLVVTGSCHTGGHLQIARNGGVIAAGPNAEINLETLTPGDQITLNIGLSLPTFNNLRPDVKEVVGGDVTLLRNGQATMTANRFINSRDGEYPRTMVGYNADRSRMIWCAVDGKTSTNTGCSYPQGADLMLALGCVDAINFDGGGSTMMWLEQPGIVNSPSDGNERAVGSGLFAVLQKPSDNQLATIQFLQQSICLPRYAKFTPTLLAYNIHGQLIDLDCSDFTLSCDKALGSISSDLQSLLAEGSGIHALTATASNGATATMAVNIVDSAPVAFAQSEMLVDDIHGFDITTYATVNGQQMPLAPQALTWNSDDPSIATVDPNGHVIGHSDGSCRITGSVGEFEGTIEVTVECPKAHSMPIAPSLQPDAWKLTASGLKGEMSATPSGLKLDYDVTSSRSPKLTLSPTAPIRLWSVPDLLELTASLPADGNTPTTIAATITPNGMRNVSVTAQLTENSDNTTTAKFNWSELIDVTNPAVYPLTLQNIAFGFDHTGSGTITIEQIATLYTGYSGIETIPHHPSEATDPYAPVEWYNLQGLRVNAPTTPGVYLRRQGSKCTKIYLQSTL